MEFSQSGKNVGIGIARRVRAAFAAMILAGVCGWLSGCLEPVGVFIPGEKVLKSLEMAGPDTVEEGGVANYSVTATYQDGTTEDVTDRVIWTVSDNVGAFKSSGEYSAPTLVLEETTVTVAATFVGVETTTASKGFIDYIKKPIKVLPPTNPLESVAIEGPNGACEGGSVPFKCIALFRDGTKKDVTASSTWTLMTGPGTLGKDGVYTAPESVTGDTPAVINVAYSQGVRLRRADRTFNVTGIRVSTDALSWDVNETATKTFTIDGLGSTVVNYTIGEIPEWLTVAPATGSMGTQVSVQVGDRTKLQSGTNTAMLKIIPNIGGITGSAKTVTVTVLAAVISLSVTDMDFSTDKTTQTFEIWNSGQGTLNYTLSSDANWLTLSPSNGQSAGEHATVTATVNRDGMTAGNYTAKITATSQTAAGKTINVTMSVSQSEPPTQDAVDKTGEVMTAGMQAPVASKVPTLDGTMSTGEWADAYKYTMNASDTTAPGVRASGSAKTAEDTSATIYLKHDADYLYVAVNVTDNNVVGTATNVWDADSVELFVDTNNSKSTNLGLNRMQFDVNAGGAVVSTPAVPSGSWTGKAALRTGGYVVEYRLSKSALSLGASGTYGIDVNVNDVEPTAGTLSANYWFFSTGTDPEMNESQWGKLTLIAPAAPPTPTNKAPTANAGLDQTVTDADNSGSESITLDGSGSTDSDGTIVNYTWTEGSTSLYTGTNAKQAVNLVVGSHTITLTVQDNGGLTATDTVVITVNKPTTTPTTGTPMTTANRTSGMAPLSVFFDAVNFSSPAWTSGVVQPSDGDYASFDYVWDFGDANSGTWGTNGKSRNSATGCVAAHVYETPGTYRVTLTVTDAAGTKRVYTQDITVSDFSGTTYYVSSSGNDSNNGTSTSTPWQSVSKAMSAAGANKRILFKRGETFSTSGTSVNAAGPGIIGAYGTGNKPVIKVTGTGGGIGFNASDWRIMDLDIAGPGGSTDQNGAVYLNASKGINNILLLRLTSRDFRTGITWSDYSSMYSTPHDGNAIVDCLVANAQVNGTFVGGRRLAILGSTIQNIATSHVLRVWQGHKCVLSHNILHNPGPTRHALKLHSPTVGDGRPETRYVEVSDNDFLGKTWAISIGPQDNLENEHVSHVVFERNRTHSEQSIDFDLKISAQDITVRNNIFDGTGSSKWYQAVGIERRGVEPAPTNIRVFNNTVYKSDSGTEFWICNVSSAASNVTVKNNLGCAPNIPTKGAVTGTCPGLVIGNNLVTNTPGFVNASSGDFRIASGSPAIDAGTPLNWVRTDFAHTSRPQRSQYDLGAYEYRP